MKPLILAVAALAFLAVILPIQGQEKRTHPSSNKQSTQHKQQPQPSPPPAAPTIGFNAVNQQAPDSENNGTASDSNNYFSRLFPSENISSFGLLLVGIAGVIIAICTLKKISAQTGSAIKTARAAKKSADALINAERAWIMVDIEWANKRPYVVTHAGPRTEIDILLICRNQGKSPAWITERQVKTVMVTVIPPVPQMDGAEVLNYIEPLTANGPESKLRRRPCCEGLVQPEGPVLLVYGVVKYRDVFRMNRETWFGYEISGAASDPRLGRLAGYQEYNHCT
jgi:hypothetical protein